MGAADYAALCRQPASNTGIGSGSGVGSGLAREEREPGFHTLVLREVPVLTANEPAHNQARRPFR